MFQVLREEHGGHPAAAHLALDAVAAGESGVQLFGETGQGLKLPRALECRVRLSHVRPPTGQPAASGFTRPRGGRYRRNTTAAFAGTSRLVADSVSGLKRPKT
jgi:hypothetical protein